MQGHAIVIAIAVGLAGISPAAAAPGAGGASRPAAPVTAGVSPVVAPMTGADGAPSQVRRQSGATRVFVAPLDGSLRVLTPFRAPARPYGPGHRGVDLAAAADTTVRAAGEGTVVFAGMVAGRPVVSIQHANGIRTTYEPVIAAVKPAERVQRGQPIGAVQQGHPTCPATTCLHWGARLPDRSYLDPMALLGPWRVRLLPWDGAADQYGA